MANFTFETLTSQGVLYAPSDTMTFSNAQASAQDIRIDFGPLFTVTDLVDGISKSVGLGFAGSPNVVFANGSQLRIGTTGNDALSLGSATGSLYGGPGDDTLTGGAGNDLLVGGQGVDVMTGGGGIDHFLFTNQDSSLIPDRITDWKATDYITLGNVAGTAANYFEAVEPDLQTARTIAQAEVSQGKTYSALQVGSDVYLFGEVPNSFNNLVQLNGKSLADIDFANIVADGPASHFQSPPVLPPPPPPVSPPPVSPPPPPPPPVSPPPSGDLSTTLTTPGYTAWAYDSAHDQIDIVTSSGSLFGWSIGQHAYTLNLQIGGTPVAAATSLDGHYLIVGNHDAVSVNGVASNVITRVDLNAQTVSQITESQATAQTRGDHLVQITSDGTVIFTPQVFLTGTNGFREFSVGAAAPTITAAPAFANLDPQSYLGISDDRRYILIGGGSGSGAAGPERLSLYDSTTGQISAVSNDLAGSSFTSFKGDISTAAGLVAVPQVSEVKIYDLALRPVETLSTSTNSAVFSADGHQMFTWDTAFNTVSVFDTQGWQKVASFSVSPTDIHSSDNLGLMDVVSQGRVLVLDNGLGLQLVDLSTIMHLNLMGDASSQKLFGSIGSDSLSGGDGADTLSGGGEADVLTGGAGADLFVVHAGESPAAAGHMDRITDWSSSDTLSFSGAAGTAGNYVELTAGSFNEAQTTANQQIASGAADYVAVQVGDDVLVFADSRNDNGAADDAVTLSGRSLSDISFANIVGAQGVAPSEPGLPAATIPTISGTHSFISGDMDAAQLTHLIGASIDTATPTSLMLNGAFGVAFDITGTGLTYDLNEQLTGGTATQILFHDATAAGTVLAATVNAAGISAAPFDQWVLTNATQTAFTTILAGNDSITGGSIADQLHGFDGDDVIFGMGGGDTITGGTGNDVIYANMPPTFFSATNPNAQTYLRGEAGDDYIVGGGGFDDINGNQGNDTLSGGNGDDWVVGGKDNDLQFGDAGNDIVWGNLGADTLDGGDGNDQVRGGQGDDVLFGGAGNDYVSGDRGNDTETGGAGADTFHSFSGAGLDVVTDFNQSEGDRVMLDPGTTYTLSQVGGDTVIDMGNGDQLILRSVQLSTLKDGWIFVG